MRRILFSLAILGLLFCGSALAAPRLLVYIPKKAGQTLSVEMSQRMLRLTIQNRLGSKYESIDWIESQDAAHRFVESSRQPEGETWDAILMEAGSEVSHLLSGFRFRWVLGGIEAADSMTADSWIEIPASIADGGYSAWLISHWVAAYSAGYSLTEATSQAYWRVFRFLDALGRNVLNFSASEGRPRIHQRGSEWSWVVPGEYFGPWSPSIETDSFYSHSNFERFSIQSLTTFLLPGEKIVPEKVPSVRWLAQVSPDVAWSLIQNLRHSTGDSSDGMDAELLRDEGEEIIVDGDSLRYFFSPLREVVGEEIDLALNEVRYAILKRVGEELEVRVFFSQQIQLNLLDPKKAPRMALYAVSIPSTVRFSMAFDEDIFMIKVKQPWTKFVKFKINIPYGFPDSVAFKGATVNLMDGVAQVKVGLLRNTATVVGKAQLIARSYEGIDVFASILANIKWFLPMLLLAFVL